MSNSTISQKIINPSSAKMIKELESELLVLDRRILARGIYAKDIPNHKDQIEKQIKNIYKKYRKE